jgi:hypothetical protein
MKKTLCMLLAVTILVSVACWLEVYLYRDCRRVGHSTLYCLTN